MNHFQKQSVLAIALCLLSTSFMLQSKVQPIYPGENLWQILKRIGCTEDIIEGKLDIFMEILCACPNSSCPKAITQADVDSDGFTITAPGVYCLAEDITVPSNKDGIRIHSACVTLDLRGHVIKGDDLTTGGIVVDGDDVDGIGTTTPANVTIKNGIIKNHEFQGVFISEVLGPVKLESLMTTSCDDNGIEIDDASKGVIVQNCISSENTGDGFNVSGGSKYCVFKNCIARSNDGNGFSLDSDGFCCLMGCKAFANESSNGNFLIKFGSEHNVLFDCVASAATTGYGFRINGLHNILLHCLANDSHNVGFFVDGGENVIRDCVSHSNSDGFNIVGDDNQVTGCDAVNNVSDGFSDSGSNNRVLNNISHDNGTQYSGLPFEASVVAATGYWANIAP